MALPIALARLLVQACAPGPSEGFVRLDSTLRQGMPHPVVLQGSQRLLLIAPSGVAALWRDLDPAQVVAASAPQAAADAGSPAAPAIAARLPLRLLFQVGGRTLGAAPLVCGGRQLLGEQGAAQLELQVLEWELHAGTLRGPGDFGSRLSIAWRAADRAVEHYADPPLNPVFVQRQPPQQRLESRVGRVRTVLNARFAYKKAYGVTNR